MKTSTVIAHVSKRLKQDLLRVSLALLIVLLSSLFGLLSPWPLKIVVDSVLGDQPLPGILEGIAGPLRRIPEKLLLATLSGGLLLSLIQRALDLANAQIQTRLSGDIQLAFKSQIYDHVQRLSLAYHRSGHRGDVLNRINTQAGAISQMALAILPLTQSLVTIVGMLWIAFLLDSELALLSLIVIPLLYYSVGHYTSRIEPAIRRIREREAQSLSILAEAFSLLPITIVFGQESRERNRYQTLCQDALRSRIGLTLRQSVFAGCVGLVAAAGTALVIGVGSLHVLRGELTVGLLLVVITYIGSVYTPLQSIAAAVGNLQERITDLKMAFELLELKPDFVDSPGALALDRCDGNFRFDDVIFSYSNSNRVFEGLTLEIPSGKLTAIVGPTGTGKTTLLGLMLRFHEPQGGRITLDGMDSSQIQIRSLRRQFSIVTQEALLSSESVMDNIRYSFPDATAAEVIEAAKVAQIHERILALPQGYETNLGNQGACLSMGERQRITLARGLLRNAPILILDEPTSALDMETERAFLAALKSLSPPRTIIMVAHRLSTAREADMIIVLDGGSRVESGSHADLLSSGGAYARLSGTADLSPQMRDSGGNNRW